MSETLWDAPAPYQPHSATSRDAALSIRDKAPSLRLRVLEALRERSMTDEELIETFGLAPNTIRPRRIELLHSGLVEPAGTKKTSSGRSATVWSVTKEQS